MITTHLDLIKILEHNRGHEINNCATLGKRVRNTDATLNKMSTDLASEAHLNT